MAILLLFLPLWAAAQSEAPKKFQAQGYVKFLQTNSFLPVPGLDTTLKFSDNLIHNRFNLHYYQGKKWEFALEMRNRLFYGDQVRQAGYGDKIDQYDGLIDLSTRWIDEGGFLLHSIIDRAYVNYSHKKWDITLGRQRINWGVNLVWNPNDLFNAYNFLDFDYEERAGRDALRIQYFPGDLSRLEVAVSPADSLEGMVAAACYRFNVKGYDFQFLSGYHRGDFAVGGGWEGNLGQVGFKGEGTYFYPLAGSVDSTSALGTSLTLDYMFGSGLYLMASALYNSEGANAGMSQGGFATGQLTARNLFPAEWAAYSNISGAVHPLVNLNVGAIYGLTNNLLILLPGVTYSIKENWDIDLIGQIFYSDGPAGFASQGAGVYLRLKWSY
ncbi:MAG TPA: hypothetical protein ENJ82_10105 [Bacteroidetes bacterium]|nr:hypothetical protein [Bacteroidota bacterium]